MGWFADIKRTTRYDLPAIGGWIALRNELTVGEERRAVSSAVKGQTMNADGTVRTDVDASVLAFATVRAYLADWSEPRDVNTSSIEGLRPEIFEAIEKQVNEHIAAKQAPATAPDAPRLTLTVDETLPPAA